MFRYDVAAYIWPSYHHEPLMEHWWPEKDGEWYTVRRGTPRWEGHDMPKHPLLGFQDEADPAVMKQHVALALSHAINVFIVDWYWYDGGPCFERQLNDGLIPAVEGTDMRFCLMWANHDATSLWDMHTDENALLYGATTDRAQFEAIWTRNIERYFKHPNYYRIDGKPVLSLFLVPRLVADLGGVQGTLDAFAWLQQAAQKAGLTGVHLQAIHWQKVPHEVGKDLRRLEGIDMEALVRECRFDSCTNYQMVQSAAGSGDYAQWVAEAMSWWETSDANTPCYFPHVSVGWDETHRKPSLREAVTGRTPWAFEACLHRAKAFLDAHPDRTPLVTINSWNEWTEDSYLLPDVRWGYKYLEAVRSVFGAKA